MRILLLILIVAIPALSQTKIVTGDNLQVKVITEIQLVDNLVHTLVLPRDSAKLVNFKYAKGEEWEVTTTAKKTAVVKIVREAESGTITGAQLDPSTAKKTICCITPGAVLQYSDVLTGQTKLTVKYSRGASGTGQVFLQVGAADAMPTTLSFPSTGSWTTFKDITFTLTAKTGTGFWIRSASVGPANFDNFIFE